MAIISLLGIYTFVYTYVRIYIFVCMHVCMYFLKYNWSFLLYTAFIMNPFWKFLRKENLISVAVIASFYFHKNFNNLMSSSTLPCSFLCHLVIPSEALEPSLEVMTGSPWSCSEAMAHLCSSHLTSTTNWILTTLPNKSGSDPTGLRSCHLTSKNGSILPYGNVPMRKYPFAEQDLSSHQPHHHHLLNPDFPHAFQRCSLKHGAGDPPPRFSATR